MSRRIKAFLDTNVLVDILSSEPRPNSVASAIILDAICSGKMEGAISTQSILDSAYILSKTPGFSQTRFKEAVFYLNNYLNIYSVDIFNVESALRHPSGDFEDDVHWAFADATSCDVLITGDKKFCTHPDWEGYRKMECVTPKEFVERITAQTSAQ
jgi:predicted nucleic acid-binding protein